MQLAYEPVRSMPQRNAALKVYRGALDYFRETAQPMPTRATVQDDRHRIPAGVADTGKHYQLIVVNHQPIGVVDVVEGFPDVDTIYLQLLLVTARARHQGYGQAVVAHLQRIYGGRGWRWLEVMVINADAQRLAFWRQAGFCLQSDRRVALACGDWRQETRLRLPLTP